MYDNNKKNENLKFPVIITQYDDENSKDNEDNLKKLPWSNSYLKNNLPLFYYKESPKKQDLVIKGRNNNDLKIHTNLTTTSLSKMVNESYHNNNQNYYIKNKGVLKFNSNKLNLRGCDLTNSKTHNAIFQEKNEYNKIIKKFAYKYLYKISLINEKKLKLKKKLKSNEVSISPRKIKQSMHIVSIKNSTSIKKYDLGNSNKFTTKNLNLITKPSFDLSKIINTKGDEHKQQERSHLFFTYNTINLKTSKKDTNMLSDFREKLFLSNIE